MAQFVTLNSKDSIEVKNCNYSPTAISSQEKPDVIFRVDASTRIGTGHVMRCLQLADDLMDSGRVVWFVCRAHKGHMAKEIRRHGHKTILLPLNKIERIVNLGEELDYSTWLGVPWEQDVEQTLDKIPDNCLKWLVVDHYGIDRNWESRFKTVTGAKVLVIDGMANRIHNCDILLDQTYSPSGEERWKGLLPSTCRRLVGPKFALLRREFIEARRSYRKRDGIIRRILITFGGVDEPNVTSVAIEALDKLPCENLEIDVAIGARNPHFAGLSKKFHQQRNIHLHLQPKNMAQLMANADLSISAGGTLLLEQCFMQLPSVVVSIAHNQIGPARALHDLGAVAYLGNVDIDNLMATKESIRWKLLELLSEPNQLIQMQIVAEKLMKQPKENISQFLTN